MVNFAPLIPRVPLSAGSCFLGTCRHRDVSVTSWVDETLFPISTLNFSRARFFASISFFFFEVEEASECQLSWDQLEVLACLTP